MPFDLYQLNDLTHEKIDLAIETILKFHAPDADTPLFIEQSRKTLSPHERLHNLIDSRYKPREDFIFGLVVFSSLLGAVGEEVFYLREGCELHRAGLIFLQFIQYKNSTCLHDAIRYCSHYRNDLVGLLLMNGAEPNVLNHRQEKPVHLAVKKVKNVDSKLFKENIQLIACLVLSEIEYNLAIGEPISAIKVIDSLFNLDLSGYFIKKIVRDIADLANQVALGFSGEELITLGKAKLANMPPLIQLGQVIGAGAYGLVYKGLMKDVNQLSVVAIKTNVSVITEEEIQNEIAVLKQLNHPNIVGYLGSYKLTKGIAFVMHYASRGNLDNFIMSNPSELVLNRLYSFTKQINLGLAYLHKKGYVHLDLKPYNILLDEHRLMLADFGSTAKSGTYGFREVTTLDYRSPELFDLYNPYTFPNDIYSFGICLGVLATQCYPWETLLEQVDSQEAYCSLVKAKVQKGEQPTFGNKKMPTPVANLVKLCLFKDPNKRPTCDDLSRHIEENLAGLS